MYKTILLIGFLCLSLIANSQDRIYRTNGDVIKARISAIDSTHIYFSNIRYGDKIYTSLPRSKVIRYDSKRNSRQRLFAEMDPLVKVDYYATKQKSIDRPRQFALSGNLGLNYNKTSPNNDESVTTRQIEALPMFAFLLGKQNEIGFGIGYQSIKQTNISLDYRDNIVENEIKQNILLRKFYYRHYMKPENVKPYFEGGFHISNGTVKFDDKDETDFINITGIEAKLGLVVSLANRFELDLNLSAVSLDILSYDYKYQGNSKSDTYTYFNSFFDTQSIQIGLRWLL